MRSWKTTWLSLAVAVLVAGAAAYRFWRGYQDERRAHEQVLVGRGEAVLSALDGGLRSHRRLGNWFQTGIGVVLSEAAATPGIRGLAIFDDEGAVVASGGQFPESLKPEVIPQWVEDGLLLCRKERYAVQQIPGGGMHRGGPPGFTESGLPRETPEMEALFSHPVWLAVFLDDKEYLEEVGYEQWRLAVSLGVTFLAVGLGVLAIVLAQRQGRLAAELSLARERERRLQEMSQLGAGLAHETKNPLGLIRGLAQSVERRAEGNPEVRKEARQIVDEADRVVSRINAFLTYARPVPPDRKAIELGALVSETAGLFRDEAEAKGVELKIGVAPSRVEADPVLVREVVVNLMANALAACKKGDGIEVTLGKDGTGESLVLSVRDTGQGIASEDLSSVIKPYFSRRPGGTGLGLAIVDQVVRGHGWGLQIESAPGRGTTVFVENIKPVV